MTIKISRIIPWAEKRDMEELAIAQGWYRNDRRMFTPGMAWYQPFYWHPAGWPGVEELAKWHERRLGRVTHCVHGDPFLSVHYWRDWADKRPPIEVVCPNGATWEIDRKSSNGDGWTVLQPGGIADPNITAAPSIIAGNYHGFLRNGEFTADLDGKNFG